jgi:hypothetical protein
MMRRALSVLIPACLFVLVLGLKLDVINRFGSDLPNWDQWDAEGLHIYLPWAEHRLGPADFFRPQNEHRIVLTKLLGFLELLINGQWDARLQCVVNALLHCSLAVLFFGIGRRHLPRPWHPGLFALVALLFGLPLAWQNVVSGFHSQQYFLLGLSLGALGLLPFSAPWSRRWWTGAACAGLAVFSMGSGFFAAAMVIPLVVFRCWLGRLPLRPFRPTLVLGLGVVAAGCLGRVTVSGHDILKAHSIGEFVLYVIHSLQWPSPDHAWLALVFWSPLVVMTWVLSRSRVTAPQNDFPLLVLGLGCWVGLQILATAYARGAGAEPPTSRYVDTLVLGILANALALGWLANHTTKIPRYFFVGGTVVWVCALGLGLYVQSRAIYREVLPDIARERAGWERNVRQYLATGDVSFLQEPDIPYPGTKSFRERIDLPALQAILPVSVRRPLRLDSVHPGPFTLRDTLPARPLPDALEPGQPKSTIEANRSLSATPSLEFARTWNCESSDPAGEWVSLPFDLPHRTYLRFLVAGGFGEPGTTLVLRNPTLGFVLANVQPVDGRAHATWRTVDVLVPAGRVELCVRRDDHAPGFAFSEPVELAPLSYWSSLAVRTGRLLWPAAAALAVLLWALEGTFSRHR